MTLRVIKEKATGAALIIAPGGGHRFLSIDMEGYTVAKYYQSLGVADGKRAIRLVRSITKN